MDERSKAELGKEIRNVLATFVGRQTVALPEATLLGVAQASSPSVTVEQLHEVMAKLVDVGLARQVLTYGWAATSSTRYAAIGTTDPWLGWTAA